MGCLINKGENPSIRGIFFKYPILGQSLRREACHGLQRLLNENHALTLCRSSTTDIWEESYATHFAGFFIIIILWATCHFGSPHTAIKESGATTKSPQTMVDR